MSSNTTSDEAPTTPPDNFEQMSEDRTLRLPDGRKLSYAVYGAPLGRPVFYFHGWPSSRLEARLHEAPALQAGVRLIAIDRPGLG